VTETLAIKFAERIQVCGQFIYFFKIVIFKMLLQVKITFLWKLASATE